MTPPTPAAAPMPAAGRLSRLSRARRASRSRQAARQPGAVLAVVSLAAAALAWAALPMSGASGGARLALVAAAGCAAMSLVRVAVVAATERPGAARRRAEGYVPVAQAWPRLWMVFRLAPWAQGMTIAAVVLEALHRSRPWHTAVLGVVLLGYLLALHLAESAARPAVLRPQLPLAVAGVCLAGLSAAAAALPATSGGAGWLSAFAAVAAIVVAALALPV